MRSRVFLLIASCVTMIAMVLASCSPGAAPQAGSGDTGVSS